MSKETAILKDGTKREFNGLTINSMPNYVYQITQTDKIKSVKVPCNREEFVSERAKCQYIGVRMRPDISAEVPILASACEETAEKDFKR